MNFDPVSMPKVELHCHLDGSLSKEFLMQTLQLSTLDMHTIQAPANCQSLAEYLTCFDLPVSALQEKEHIRDAVVDVVRQAAAENVRYMEIRFAPMLSVNSHLDLENVVQAAVYGCQKAFDRYGVFTNLILCAMRHHSPQQNHLVVRCAREFLGNVRGSKANGGACHNSFRRMWQCQKCRARPPIWSTPDRTWHCSHQRSCSAGSLPQRTHRF